MRYHTMYIVDVAQREKCFESEFERHRKQLSRKQQLALEAVDGSSTHNPQCPLLKSRVAIISIHVNHYINWTKEGMLLSIDLYFFNWRLVQKIVVTVLILQKCMFFQLCKWFFSIAYEWAFLQLGLVANARADLVRKHPFRLPKYTSAPLNYSLTDWQGCKYTNTIAQINGSTCHDKQILPKIWHLKCQGFQVLKLNRRPI